MGGRQELGVGKCHRGNEGKKGGRKEGKEETLSCIFTIISLSTRVVSDRHVCNGWHVHSFALGT